MVTQPAAIMDADYPVHPAAAVFPMLDADELAALADDIFSNGLISPLMLDAAGEVLVDGRNRREACRIAGVEPRYELLPEGVNPIDFIASVNLQRRHMSKGQQAMALAMLYPEPAKAGRRKNGCVAQPLDFDKSRLSRARSVLRVAPDDLAPLVLSGARSLDDAFAEVRERQDSEASQDAQMRRLREESPDLADLVVEARLTLAEAHASFRQRLEEAERAEKSKRETLIRLTEFAYRGTAAWASPDFADEVYQRMKDAAFRAELTARLRIDDEPADLAAGIKALTRILKEVLA